MKDDTVDKDDIPYLIIGDEAFAKIGIARVGIHWRVTKVGAGAFVVN